MITDQNLYSMKAKGSGFVTSRKIQISAIDAITLSDPNIKSDEVLVHVRAEYDYRYNCQQWKDTVILLLRKLADAQFQQKLREEQVRIFIVNRQSLKIYATLKTEQAVGIFRRPDAEFEYDDQMFSNIFKDKNVKVSVPLPEEVKEESPITVPVKLARQTTLNRTQIEKDHMISQLGDKIQEQAKQKKAINSSEPLVKVDKKASTPAVVNIETPPVEKLKLDETKPKEEKKVQKPK